MIITRTPLRVSFVGGGSDIPWFFDEEPGAVVAAAIDQYVYVTVNTQYERLFKAAYTQLEAVERLEDLKHELIRETLLGAENYHPPREIHSIADIPGGTGLGSSSAFTVGLLRALYPHLIPEHLAYAAVGVELGRCKKPIGVQDQHVAAYGGLNLYEFGPKGQSPRVTPIDFDYKEFSSHILLLDTGRRRKGDAGQELTAQRQDRESVRSLAGLASDFAYAIADHDFQECGGIMQYAWKIKSAFLADPQVDSWYHMGMQEGAWGGKLCGAGGGGFMLFIAPPDRHYEISKVLGMRRVAVTLGVRGSEVLFHG